jgi:hypothetical protein
LHSVLPKLEPQYSALHADVPLEYWTQAWPSAQRVASRLQPAAQTSVVVSQCLPSAHVASVRHPVRQVSDDGSQTVPLAEQPLSDRHPATQRPLVQISPVVHPLSLRQPAVHICRALSQIWSVTHCESEVQPPRQRFVEASQTWPDAQRASL